MFWSRSYSQMLRNPCNKTFPEEVIMIKCVVIEIEEQGESAWFKVSNRFHLND